MSRPSLLTLVSISLWATAARAEPANLARMTIDLMFNAIADHMPDLTPISTPERLRSGWLNGIKHWQVDYTGKTAVAK